MVRFQLFSFWNSRTDNSPARSKYPPPISPSVFDRRSSLLPLLVTFIETRRRVNETYSRRNRTRGINSSSQLQLFERILLPRKSQNSSKIWNPGFSSRLSPPLFLLSSFFFVRRTCTPPTLRFLRGRVKKVSSLIRTFSFFLPLYLESERRGSERPMALE